MLKSKRERSVSVNSKKRKHSIDSTKEKPEVCKLEEFGLSKEIAEKLIQKGIKSLFEVQEKVFHPVFNGENTIVASLTGSGKTLSFIIPILEKFKAKNKFSQTEPLVIVVAPTRELAIQISKEFSSLSSKNNREGFFFKVATVYGGVSIDDQRYELKRGVDIVVGTPGRILDMINRNDLKLTSIKVAVLDEADKMLEMGFQENIEEIFDKIYEVRKKLQVCLFSATMHKWVVDTAQKIMRHKEHTFVNLVKNLKGRCAVGVQHLAVNCLKNEKITTIADLITCYGGMNKSTIVFVPTKRECNTLMVSDKLKQEVLIVHGDINQKQREASIDAFKSGKVNVLVATDVAARGLDIPMVDLIIQSEPPKEIDSYIHRAGRTARAGRTGTCITLYTKMTEGLLTRIENTAKISFKKIGAPQRDDIIKASIRDIKEKLHDIHDSSIEGFKKDANSLLSEYEAPELVSRLLAFLAGQTSEMKSRSILCGAEGFVSYKLDTDHSFNSASYAWSCLRKVISQDILNKVKGLRTYTNMKGAIFDIEESDVKEVELAIKSYKTPHSNFVIAKAESLPELTQSDQRSFTRTNVDTRRKDIFVGNLPYHATEKDMENHLVSNGIPLDGIELRFSVDSNTKTHKGFCFISCYDEDKFNKVLNMKNKSLGGKMLRVDDALNKKR